MQHCFRPKALLLTSALAASLTLLTVPAAAQTPSNPATVGREGQEGTTTQATLVSTSERLPRIDPPATPPQHPTELHYGPGGPPPIPSRGAIDVRRHSSPQPQHSLVSLGATSSLSPLATVSDISFIGAQQDGTPMQGGLDPADPVVAVGTNEVVETVNNRWTAYDRSGNQLYTVHLTDWFSYGTAPVVDPHVIWEPFSQRFYLVATGKSSRDFFISVSPPGTALGNWCNWHFTVQATGSDEIDYPLLGSNAANIYVTLGLADPSTGAQHDTIIYQMPRTGLAGCNNFNYSYWPGVKDPSGSPAFAPAPAFTATLYGGTGGDEYFVNSYNGGGCGLALRKISGGATLGAPVNIPVPCYTKPTPAPQQGSAAPLDTSDCRLAEATISPNGDLVTALTSAYQWAPGTVNSVVNWYNINMTGASVNAQGILGSSGIWYMYPGVQEDSNGNYLLVYGVSNSTTFPSARFVGINSGGVENELVLQAGTGGHGTGNYGPQRWGDFSTAALDLTDLTKIWMTAMYANANGTWGTWIARGGA